MALLAESGDGQMTAVRGVKGRNMQLVQHMSGNAGGVHVAGDAAAHRSGAENPAEIIGLLPAVSAHIDHLFVGQGQRFSQIGVLHRCDDRRDEGAGDVAPRYLVAGKRIGSHPQQRIKVTLLDGPFPPGEAFPGFQKIPEPGQVGVGQRQILSQIRFREVIDFGFSRVGAQQPGAAADAPLGEVTALNEGIDAGWLQLRRNGGGLAAGLFRQIGDPQGIACPFQNLKLIDGVGPAGEYAGPGLIGIAA